MCQWKRNKGGSTASVPFLITLRCMCPTPISVTSM
jgi:hypothetical protein